MKGHILGLLFATGLCFLMCLPFVVSNDIERSVVDQPELSLTEETALTDTTPVIRVPELKSSARTAQMTVGDEHVGKRASAPVSDANGLPVLRTSYLRSNYQAFCLTGNGG